VADPSIFRNVCYMNNVTARFFSRPVNCPLLESTKKVKANGLGADKGRAIIETTRSIISLSETSHYRARDIRETVKPCSMEI